MVRLKEVFDIEGGMFIIISIPYGAIKSIAVLHIPDIVLDFNSLWCD